MFLGKNHIVKGKTYGKTTCIPNIKKAYIDFEQFKETAVDVSERREHHNSIERVRWVYKRCVPKDMTNRVTTKGKTFGRTTCIPKIKTTYTKESKET